ncbi:putative ribonuclease H-like domain-containing protein [Tanacetum coccineum]
MKKMVTYFDDGFVIGYGEVTRISDYSYLEISWGKDMHYPFTTDDEASYHEDASENGTATNKPKQQQQQLIPTTTTISNIKLPILKKEEYDIWAMEMEHYLEYIDNDVWKVIQNGNSKKRISTGKDGVVRILPPVSAAEIHAVEKERKARTILLMAIPKEHLRRFHGMDDAKEIWEAIRTRFGGNANSKKMQKAVLKQQFEAFTISSSEGLEKGYDRFQQLLSQLEAHGAEVSTEDANHKFLRSLPPAWSNLAMTMRTKPDVDTLSIDDLYNNLRVFEQELTSTSKSSASAQNYFFNPFYFSSNNIQEREVPAGFADEVIYSLFAKQSEDLDLLHEDLEQIDDIDIEEMDINWQIAMIAIRMKKFYKKTGRRVRIDGNKPVGFDKKKLECFKCHNTGHFARECPSKGTNDGKKRDSFYQDQGAGKKEQNQNCLLTIDDGVPHPLYGDYTPKPQEEIDDSLYVYGKKGPQKPEISDSDDNSTEHSTCQSNDSEGSFGNPSEHSSESESESISVPNEMSTSKSVTTNEKVVSESKEVEPIYLESQGHNLTIAVGERPAWSRALLTYLLWGEFDPDKTSGCRLLEAAPSRPDSPRKMAREAELKKQRVFNTGNGVAKPVWNNANRVNRANHFIPRPVQLNTDRQNDNSVRPNVNTGRANVNSVKSKVNSVRHNVNSVRTNVNTGRSKQPVPTSNSNSFSPVRPQDHPLKNMEDKGIFDSGCSGHMTGNKDHLDDFEECKGGSVTFGGSKGYITGKGRIRVGNLDFDSVSFVKELGHFNLFSISQICDKQHKVLFTETECLVVSSDFKMPDENQILLKVPRHHNMYSFDMKTPTPAKGFACLIAKATSDESKLWHRRLGHINFKNLNKLVKGNLVRGLPSKVFKNDHTCVACHKGKQHRASCKAKLERLITEPLHTLHMDLFGPTSVKSINHASYCLVITDDCTRFSWVFFLASKDKTSGILHNFIRQIENQLSHRVKIIRSDNGTEFKNRDMLEFCGNKGIKQEYSNARTPQQNGVAERMNRTLIEAARTMLADSLLPTTFWAEAVSTACYIFNRVRVTKPQNKTPYELLFGHKPIIRYIRPFGCYVITLDTLSVLGKFNGKSNEGFLVDKPNVKGVGYRWMFNIDYLTDSMNYISVSLENQANPHAGASEIEETLTTPQQEKKDSSTDTSEDNPMILAFQRELEEIALKHLGTIFENNTASTPAVNTGSESVNTGIFDEASYDEEGVITDFNSLPTEIEVSPTPTLRIHNIHPKSQILGDLKSAVQTRSKEEPKKIFKALQDDSWVQAMQEELLQFKLQQVWVLVDLPHGMKVIGTKWVYRNKRDERGVVVRNKARLVAQGYTQEEGIDYDECLSVWTSLFVDPDHPKQVYKVVKALFGLHQAPRAWYATLSTFLEKHGYKRGTIDKTLFIKRDKKDIMLV